MRRVLVPAFTILTVLSLRLPAMAQDDFAPDDDLPRSRSSSGGIFGAGGGVSPAWYLLDVDAINRDLAPAGFPALPGDGMFLFGGHGYAYVVFIPNLRVGGMGAAGSISAERASGMLLEAADLSYGFGGVTLEYVIPFGRFHLAVGGMLGGGSRTLTLTRSPNAAKSWPLTSTDPQTETRLELGGGFFAWHPWLTAEFDVNPFIVAAVTGGWQGSSGTTWRFNDRFEARDVPDYDPGGAFLRFSLTIGLFIGE